MREQRLERQEPRAQRVEVGAAVFPAVVEGVAAGAGVAKQAGAALARRPVRRAADRAMDPTREEGRVEINEACCPFVSLAERLERAQVVPEMQLVPAVVRRVAERLRATGSCGRALRSAAGPGKGHATHPENRTECVFVSASFRLVDQPARGALALVVVIACASALGCSRPAPDATPDGALRTWLEKMEAAEDDPAEMRSAYELFGPRAKKDLAERAERAGRAEGRKVQPWEVLAEGRFGLKFRPQRMTVTIDPKTPNEAVVAVLGADPNVERALVHCDREPLDPEAARRPRRAEPYSAPTPDGWRVEPDFPPPPRPHER